ncbi:hypothetical protein BHE74_00006474 [Ensete ventricosum]|nr:hypothetical protein BHE74_00006474 [Ensete ventricosum]
MGAAPIGVVVDGGRPCRRQPLRVVPLPVGCLPTGDEPAIGCPFRAGRGRPLAAAPAAWPRAVAAPCGCCDAAGRPFAGGLAAVGRSYILVFNIRMEKMKEIKRPPLAVST